MSKQKQIWVIVLTMLIACNGSTMSYARQASSSRTAPSDKEALQACREAVLELKFRREAEETLKKQVEELKALGTAKDQRIGHLEAAIAKYEAAITARTQAEALVSELRSNYEKQVAIAEKSLAIEQQKTNFWRVFARIGLVAGLIVGGVVGYALGQK